MADGISVQDYGTMEQTRRGVNFVNFEQDDQMEIKGYKRNTPKTVITWFFILITVGILRLVFYWLPHLMTKATHSECRLEDAEVVILKDKYKQYFVSQIRYIRKNSQRMRPLPPLPTNGREERSSMTKAELGGPSNLHPLHAQKGALFLVIVGVGLVSNGMMKTSKEKEAGSTAKDSMNGGTSFSLYSKSDVVRYFISKKVKYLWNQEYGIFQKVTGMEDNVSCTYYHQCQGLSYEEQQSRRVLYGDNVIAVHVTPIITLLFKQVLSPFYIFQVCSCCLWFYDEYYYYAGCILFISILSIITFVYQTRKMQRALRETISSSTIVTVCRGENEYVQIPSEDLVPGDVIEIPQGGCLMQCDAVLLTGNCIVNESMLTGESVPVTKTPIPNPKLTQDDSVLYFNIKDHSRNVLFCGTNVIQTRYYGGQRVQAVVFRTGFSTAKGDLVRSIMYPKPVDFKFNRDTYKYIGVLALISLAGFIFTVILMTNNDEYVVDIIVRSLDLITIVVPPALPAALTVGIVFAQNRLKNQNIYCISPRSINLCGGINTVCFDKTGTLTEEGLDMQGIVPVNNGKFDSELRNLNLLPRGHFMDGMATCHSLTIINGELSGDPLELIIFQSIGWELTEPGPEESSNFDMLCPIIVKPKSSPTKQSFNLNKDFEVNSDEIGIIRQFTFSSSLQRMSVVTRKLGDDHFNIYTKGAPEMIASLCVKDTVPDDFQSTLMTYTRHGYRVLALAYKPLPAKLKYTKLQRIQREQVERGLTFLGLIVMENRLKPETTPVIKQLIDANIRPVMVTGDNMLTAMSVARECEMVKPGESLILVQALPPNMDNLGNPTSAPTLEFVYTDPPDEQTSRTKLQRSEEKQLMIDPEMGNKDDNYHFAVTGKSWGVLREYFPALIPKIVYKGTVFARMSPDQKAQLVESLQDEGYYVGMCGDGANDCGALKTAHAGISLSEAEASVASPFTSKTNNISCVPTTIREGRCALMTSFGIFKYMACYSLTQFISVIILYIAQMNLGDFQFLFIDLFLVTSLSITFGYTASYKKLSKVPPPVSLLTLAPILTLVGQISIIMAAQAFAYVYIRKAPWFVPWEENPDDEYDYQSYENYAVYTVSAYQYVILAVIFAKGKPYRQPIYTNLPFLANVLICLGFNVWFNIYPTDGVADFMALQPPPSVPYRFIFLGVAAANFILCLGLQMFVLESRFVTVTLQGKIDRCCPGQLPKYLQTEEELRNDPNWPNVKSEDLAETFHRLDSAYHSMSQVNLGADLDDISLSSESEDGSVKDVTADDVQLVSSKEGKVNLAFELETPGTRL